MTTITMARIALIVLDLVFKGHPWLAAIKTVSDIYGVCEPDISKWFGL